MIDQKVLKGYAELCRISYMPQDKALKAYQEIGYNANSLPQLQPLESIYTMQVGDDFLVLLTGTNQFWDWIGNILAIPGWYVHAGYAAIADALTASIKQAFKDSGAERLILIGHSKGGAVAALIAQQLYEINVGVVSFGAPRIGSQSFADNYPNSRYIRVTHPLDVVARMPFHSMGYRHCGIPVVWDDQGSQIQIGQTLWLQTKKEKPTWQLFLRIRKALQAHFSYWRNCDDQEASARSRQSEN